MASRLYYPAVSYNKILILKYFLMYIVQVLTILGKMFGTQKNSKGFKMLPPYLRIIQGDGISYDTIDQILSRMKKLEWSADNIAFGSGGALLQKLNRDTQKCAFKCSYCVIDHEGVRRKKLARLCSKAFRIPLLSLQWSALASSGVCQWAASSKPAQYC